MASQPKPIGELIRRSLLIDRFNLDSSDADIVDKVHHKQVDSALLFVLTVSFLGDPSTGGHETYRQQCGS